jgi:hypothetical protein
MYNVTLFVNDSAGNLNKTQTVTHILIDNTAPNITLLTFPNVTASNYSGTLKLQGNASDALTPMVLYFNLSNAGGQVALLTGTNVGGTYNWSYTLDTTAYADGIYNVSLYARDNAGNAFVNKSQNMSITIDNNGPIITSLAPVNGTSAATSAYNFTFSVNSPVVAQIANCSLVMDGNIWHVSTGVSTSVTNGMRNASIAVGVHTWLINCTDVIGARSSSNFTMLNVTAESGSPSSGGGGTPAYWTTTFAPTDAQLAAGYVKDLGVKERVKAIINHTNHYAGVVKLTSTTATINVSSIAQTAELNIGDTKKFDVDSDSFYDVSVKLNSITGSKANLKITTIHEKVTAVQAAGNETVTTGETNETGEEVTTTAAAESLLTNVWFWVAIVVAILVILGVLSYFKVIKPNIFARSVKVKER